MYAHNSDSWSLASWSLAFLHVGYCVSQRLWRSKRGLTGSARLDTGVDLGHWQFKLQRGNTNGGIRPADNRRPGRKLRTCPFENPGFRLILRKHDIGVQTRNPQVLGRLVAKIDFCGRRRQHLGEKGRRTGRITLTRAAGAIDDDIRAAQRFRPGIKTKLCDYDPILWVQPR